MTFPNGIALSPDEKTLYVANSDPTKAIWMAFPVKDDGTIGTGRVFADVTSSVSRRKKGLPDGMKVDAAGNLFATGPGGVLVFAPDGTHLGTFATGEATANCGWGEDGSVLYITADMYIGRVRLTTKGQGLLIPQVGRSMAGAIWTVGHSNHPIDTFLTLLDGAAIRQVADVRRFPGSRRHPQFQRETLKAVLAQAGIAYHHVEGLGGRRTARKPGSPNSGWRVEAFNAYADYMSAQDFQAALADLEDLAAQAPTAIMCAEALPWQCHRRLIADALVVRAWDVWDLMPGGRIKRHLLTEFAQVTDGRLTYPATPLFASSDRVEHNKSSKEADHGRE